MKHAAANTRRAVGWRLAAAVLLLAACGGDEPGATPAATAAGAELAASAEPSAAAEPTASSGATSRDELPVINFVRADGVAIPLSVEVPPSSEYSIGLSGRYSLEERGMLFHYTEPESHIGFWMKNTHIDLSIAFVNADFRIVEIHEMPAESLTIIRPRAAHQYAVEAPAGWFAEHRVAVGDRAHFRFELPVATGSDRG